MKPSRKSNIPTIVPISRMETVSVIGQGPLLIRLCPWGWLRVWRIIGLCRKQTHRVNRRWWWFTGPWTSWRNRGWNLLLKEMWERRRSFSSVMLTAYWKILKGETVFYTASPFLLFRMNSSQFCWHKNHIQIWAFCSVFLPGCENYICGFFERAVQSNSYFLWLGILS